MPHPPAPGEATSPGSRGRAPGEGWEATVQVGPLAPELSERLWKALLPESHSGVPGSKVEVERVDPQTLRLRLSAGSTSGLRAAVNAHLRWVDLAMRVDDLARSHP